MARFDLCIDPHFPALCDVRRNELSNCCNLAFIPDQYPALYPPFTPVSLFSPVAHTLLHADAAHLIFNMVWLVIFGAPLIGRLGTLWFFVLWSVSAIAGVVLFTLLNWGEPAVLLGASGAVSGLMGAGARFKFAATQVGRYRTYILPVEPINHVLSDTRTLAFIAVWIGINLISAVGIDVIGASAVGDIAWEAHLGGFVAGFLAVELIDRLR